MRPKKVNKNYEALTITWKNGCRNRIGQRTRLNLGFPDHLKKLVQGCSAKTGRVSLTLFVTGKDEAFKIIRRVRKQIHRSLLREIFKVTVIQDMLAEERRCCRIQVSNVYKDVLKLKAYGFRGTI
jgi:hypothetical protein